MRLPPEHQPTPPAGSLNPPGDSAARIGLVLGAGGTVGQAYHAGVLAAIETDLGWDPRTADLIVGTSAGAVTGTLLRLGVPAADLAAWAVEAPLSADGRALEKLLGDERPSFPPLTLRTFLRPPRLPAPLDVLRALRKPWRIRPAVALMTLVRDGEIDLLTYGRPLDQLVKDQWPDGLWVCAARRRDGRRVVFGRARAPRARLSLAVAASCAIPGYFRSVAIGGVEYFDGGVRSPTNADVLRGEPLDLVVVVSPMTAAPGTHRTLDGPLRGLAARHLRQELRALDRAGVPCVVFEPGDAVLDAMGVNLMAQDRSERTVQESFLEAGRQAAMRRLAAALPGRTATAAS